MKDRRSWRVRVLGACPHPSTEGTYWNGERTPARKVSVCVARSSRFPMYWADALVGKWIAAVEVTYDGHTFYLDDRDGGGWYKVTKARGSPGCKHAEIEISSWVERPVE